MIVYDGVPLILVEEVIVHFDLGVGFEIIGHQHYRDLNVTEVIYLETHKQTNKQTETGDVLRSRVITFTQQTQCVLLNSCHYGSFLETLRTIGSV